ncbi:mandelate racemase/muconate lactonizing enzyme family protein [Paenibacillus radicis (ex Xue et al. 2023)]|uniref:Mandelate racemase/muconate lactonizing enzyme family protein n=1 Tax=Paenibacillus radicis (ex Xue et al. 2023) TaxID=2972489 RepID=A0ABT1YE95_9BACL|nr:mandelate racemase/muconate lactonizing enzyme family protein [Paenibacillus radicis (ex Xue et al. 2023)]MCR8631509.1 mandelate racemase/muconate lactonizing enzyme family protein [Paenibacillus radicis (ex Xue et al. 2023)]
MKITDVETYIVGNPWKNWLFVKLHTEEGIYGIGEGTLNGFAKTVEACIHELKHLYIGMSAFDVEALTLKMIRDVYSDGGQIQGSALAAIETACWDIIGKATNQPLYKLLGGRCHEKLRCYANGWYRGPRTPENFYEKAKTVVEKGYTALKFDPFGSAWRTVERKDFELALNIIAAVRDSVGPDVDILIEGHNRFSVHTALQFAEAMLPYNPAWFEAPVPPQHISSMVEVAKRSPVPIACGEDYYCREQFAELLKHDAVHIIQLEPQFLGISASKQICGMVHAHNGVIAPHSAQGPICSVVCSHLNMATPNFYMHEIFDEFNEPWEEEVLTPLFKIEQGYLQPPDRPGLGVDLNLELIAQHPYHTGNWIPLFKQGWEKREGNG